MATLDRPRPHAGLVTVFALLCFAAPAAAAPPTLGGDGAGPEEQACAGRASGDACTLPNNQLGTCGPGICNRLDYSGGSPPKAIEESCIVCKPAGAQSSGSDAGGQVDVEPKPAESGAAPAGSDTKEPPESSSRCRLAANSANPAGLALIAGLLLIVRRRRHGAGASRQ